MNDDELLGALGDALEPPDRPVPADGLAAVRAHAAAAAAAAGSGAASGPPAEPVGASRRSLLIGSIAAAVGAAAGVAATVAASSPGDDEVAGPPTRPVEFTSVPPGTSVAGRSIDHTWGMELLLDVDGFDTTKLEHMSFSGDTDSHNHGKKAIMLEAGGVKIIYKPHSLANDIFFSKLFEELSPKLTYDLRTMRSDDMGDYGWQEFACAVKPGTEDEKKKYYCRYGEIMAIAYSLAMGDLHKENIISCGEYPVIIDTETMISNSSYTLSQVKADRYSAAMTRAMKDTVLDTMLLPMNLHIIF